VSYAETALWSTGRDEVDVTNSRHRLAPSSPGPGEAARDVTDDHELVRLLRAGDEEAFETLVQRHHAAMVRLARSYVRSRAVAEEVAQEAWLGLLRGLDGFEGRSSLRTWLFRIVVNRAISTGIRERVHLTVQDSELEEDNGRFSQDGWWVTPPTHWAEEVVDRLTAPELAARVQALIEQLPPGQRAVVTLRDVQGLSSVQACAVLGISEGNQRVLLHRARARIRAELEREVLP
jgi:RNA polymerase sigma-70 factor (ECF subfamily)